MTRWARAATSIQKERGGEATQWRDMKRQRCANIKHKNLQVAEEIDLKRQWKNEKRTNIRRLNRQRMKKEKRVCFNCRSEGHTVANCPSVVEKPEHIMGVCFKCGSTEHSARACKVKIAPGSYPFAKCFICCETGHITSQCPDNPRGIYPNGGCCKLCFSVEHFKKDCPDNLTTLGIGNRNLKKITDVKSADYDSDNEEEVIQSKRKTKVVKF